MLLAVDGLSAGYRRRPVIHDVALTVRTGEIVTVLGHPGAGKTTTLRAVFGLLAPLRGSVVYRGEDVSAETCARHVALGMSYTPAERFVFPDLPVRVNLRLGAVPERSADERDRLVERVHALFPILRERRDQLAGTLRGTQQRILSLGVALMSDPRLMLFDEPLRGVAPAAVGRLLDVLRRLADEGRAVVMLERHVGPALGTADRVYVMRSGRMILEEPAAATRARAHHWDLF